MSYKIEKIEIIGIETDILRQRVLTRMVEHGILVNQEFPKVNLVDSALRTIFTDVIYFGKSLYFPNGKKRLLVSPFTFILTSPEQRLGQLRNPKLLTILFSK